MIIQKFFKTDNICNNKKKKPTATFLFGRRYVVRREMQFNFLLGISSHSICQ